MRSDKELAIKLRRENKSYGDISARLGVPKSTLSGWLNRYPFSQKVRLDLSSRSNKKVRERIKKFSETNRKRWESWRFEARKEALESFISMVNDPLFVAGNMLYWAEGDSKIKNPLRLTNTDPRMIKLYIKFLTHVLKVPKEKIRATLILYPDLKEFENINFWSRKLALPKSQFYKTQFIKGKHPTKRLSKGICMIGYNSRQIKEKVLVWIDLLSKRM